MPFSSPAILLICTVSYVLSYNMPPLGYGLKIKQPLPLPIMPPVFRPSLQPLVMPIQGQMKKLKGNMMVIKKIDPETGVWVQSLLPDGNPTAAIQHVANKLKKVINMKRQNSMTQNLFGSRRMDIEDMIDFDSRLSVSDVSRRLLNQNKFWGSVYNKFRKGIPVSNLNLYSRSFARPVKIRSFQKFGMKVNHNVNGLGLINKYQHYNSLKENNLASKKIPKHWKSSPLRHQQLADFSSDVDDTFINDFEGEFDDREFDNDFAAKFISDDQTNNPMLYSSGASGEFESLENDEDDRFHHFSRQRHINQVKDTFHSRNPAIKMNALSSFSPDQNQNKAVFGKQHNANVKIKKQWLNKRKETNLSSKINPLSQGTINSKPQDTFIESRDLTDNNLDWSAKTGWQNKKPPINNVLNTDVFHASGHGNKMAKQASELLLHKANRLLESSAGFSWNAGDDSLADEIENSQATEISPALKENNIKADSLATDIERMEIFKTKPILDDQVQIPIENNMMPLPDGNNNLQEKNHIKVLPFNPHIGENSAGEIDHEDIIDLDKATFALLGIEPNTVGFESEVEDRDHGIVDAGSRTHVPISQNTWINQKTLTKMVDMYPTNEIPTDSTGKTLQRAEIPGGRSFTNGEMIGSTFKDSFDRLDNMEFGFDSFDKDLTNFDVFAKR